MPTNPPDFPIEDLNPEWIGLKIETEAEPGITVGFRIGRYEKSTIDDTPVWRLFSDGAPWSVTLRPGARVRWTPPAGHSAQLAAGPPVTVSRPAAPAAQAGRTPQSWLTQPPQQATSWPQQ